MSENTENRLRQSKSKRTLSLMVNPDGSIINPSLDAESRSLGFNLEARTLQEFLASSNVLTEQNRRQLMEVYKSNGHEQIEYDGDFENGGSPLHLHFIFKPSYGGRVYLTVIDDTELTVAKRNAEEAIEHERTLVRVLGHEFRNPATTIGGFARRTIEKIREGKLSLEEATKPLEIIAAEAARQQRVIDNISALNLGILNLTEIDMYSDVVASVLQDSEIFATLRKKRIVVDNVNSMRMGDAVLRADLQMCMLLYANLFDNAIKFMPKVGRVCYGRQDMGSSYRLNVYNEGPVIPEELISTAFDKGVRGEGIGSGTGLGLYIARVIVQKHGGNIWAEPNRSEGANIIFELPKN